MRFSDTSRLIERKSAPLSDLARIMRRLSIDGPLLGGLLLTCSLGLVVLYSAVGEDMGLWLQQCVRLFANYHCACLGRAQLLGILAIG